MLVGLFGDLPFAVAEGAVLTFTDFSRTLAERWELHSPIGGKAVPEWTGRDAARISFSIRFDSSLGVPPQTGMLMLRTMLEAHAAHPLVIGTDYLGRFVIDSLDEDRTHFDGAGFGLVGRVRLTLIEAAAG